MPDIDMSVVGMPFFVIEQEAGLDVLAALRKQATIHLQHPCGVVRLQHDLGVVELAGNSEEVSRILILPGQPVRSRC